VGTFSYAFGPKPRLGWPSVDMFLGSMAKHVGRQGIAVVLSGMLYDGADGIAAVRRAGGATMVQDPRFAKFPSMPTAAVDLGRADLSLTCERIAEALRLLAEYGVQ
jgi:chemotaxis response regulator CheB